MRPQRIVTQLELSLWSICLPVVFLFFCVVSSSVSAGEAEQVLCHEALIKELAKLDKALLKEDGKCLEGQRKGKVDVGVDCLVSDPKNKKMKAIDKFNSALDQKCGALTALDFSALGFDRSYCGAPIANVNELKSCLVPQHQILVEQMLRAVTGNFDTPQALADKNQQKCQKALIQMATKGVSKRMQGLGKCLKSGDANACGAKLDKTFAKNQKLEEKVHKACGPVKALELTESLGLDLCSGEGGAAGIASCAGAELACLSDRGMALGVPFARLILDSTERNDVALCTGVPGGLDQFPTTARLEVNILDPFAPGGCFENLELQGPTTVARMPQVGAEIETEIVAMDLVGFSVCLNENVVLQTLPSQPSFGLIQGVQLDDRGNFIGGNSAFDVFVRIQPDTLPPVINQFPFEMQAPITSLPPQSPDNTFFSLAPQQLFLESNPGVLVGDVGNVEHEVDDDICCDLKSFVKSGDSYNDKNNQSHKRVKFTFMVKDGEDPKECVLVNWVEGSMKMGDGTFFKVRSYGVVTDANHPTKGVDSIDTDPAYWSGGGKRWNYTSENKTTASATDDPGPALSSEKGAVYALKFDMCVYCIDDVPAAAPQSGAGIGTAKQCIPWQYSVKVKDDGSFEHPVLP